MPTAYNVITIEREYGAGGTVIAEKLAKRLGWKLYDQALTADIARIAQVDPEVVARCDEQIEPLLYRLAKVFWRGSYERMLPLPDDRIFDTDAMVSLAQRLIEDVADEGHCVIVGRGSPYILRNRDDHFSVFLYAPRELKIRRAVGQKMSEQRRRNWWTPSTWNAPPSSSAISAKIGRAGNFTISCSTRPADTRP